MTNDEVKNERNYSFNWLSLLIKVVIFAILLVLLIWIFSKFTSKTSKVKKCEIKNEDYYVVSSFTDEQYKTKESDDAYTYTYTVKLNDINENNSKDVSLVSINYFHGEGEYDEYLKSSDKASIINQNNSIVIDNATSLINSSLTASEFTYDLSDIYVYDGEYHIDITLHIGDYSSINAYSNNYFVPIHINIEYTETGDCEEE